MGTYENNGTEIWHLQVRCYGPWIVEKVNSLFLRLLEEYVEMIENGESGKVTITTNRDVIKTIRS